MHHNKHFSIDFIGNLIFQKHFADLVIVLKNIFEIFFSQFNVLASKIRSKQKF